METSLYISECRAELQDAVAALGGDRSSAQLPGMAELIIQSMTGPWRSFHTPEHIFEVGDGGSPVEVIAALFHDLVYVQVDSGIHVNLARHVATYVREGDKGLVIDPMQAGPDVHLDLVMDLFGFQRGQLLSPFAGQNEFLSALLAVKLLNGILPLSALAQVAACIEATIPFRADLPDGRSCSEVLLQRLTKASLDHGLELTDSQCRDAVVMGVKVANRDVGNFASEHPSDFLNNTWNLIPETNHELLNADTYTVKGYRVSLQKMEGFLGFLQPGVVFRQFDQEPSNEEHAQRLHLAQRNLEVARLYLRMKLVAIALLEAMSWRLGQEVSLASIMGKLPGTADMPFQLENQLPVVAQPYIGQNECEITVMHLLEDGRSGESSHDSKHSPVASYLVRSIGVPQALTLLERARLFFANQLSADDFLASLDKPVMQGLQHAVIHVLDQRVQALRNL